MRTSNDSPRPDQRLGQRYHFADPDMDMFFVAALGWGPAGGLDIGQAFYVASQIEDGVGDSWVAAFGSYGDYLGRQADRWKQRGWKRAAGEARLQAFASYRSAWQFAAPGPQFASLYAKHQAAFAAAMSELAMPATFFQVPFEDKQLPGVYLQNADSEAPVVLIIGGADTCFEDLFLTIGRHLFERGYSVALVDLPGQGITQASGLHWRADAEKPISAVIDALIARFAAVPGRIALVGLSLGGYFVARAAGHETRLATVIASTPFQSPAELFALSVKSALAGAARAAPSPAAVRARTMTLWKAGASSPEDFIAKTEGMVADPSLVHVPFLSILGAGDSPVFAAQAHEWHQQIRSKLKEFVLLDETTGADGHVQVNNRRRLGQEACGWLDEIFRG
ncbi:MAG TPA: alpha/beta fold hydrolase [Dyella sp.]|uniref:alpha/beta hydrolase family protein n=1 Tax=Dyella sp. TaxID=1869338 RepID=UPI002D7969CD|nr:alpha/beta fold hydrolase [Dyella sp.]HET6554215.1 alpha/beta fold hydrolase [Dyella sp.]